MKYSYFCKSIFNDSYTVSNSLDYIAQCTYLTSALFFRYLIKCVRDIRSGSTLPETVSYLMSVPSKPVTRDFSNLQFLVALYRQRAYQ